MKKFFAVLLAGMLTISMAAAAGAATTMAAEKPMATVVLPIEDAEIIDDDTTQDQGGNNTFISIVDGYGCGNSSLNDKVIWNVDLDNGAEYVSLLFGYGKDDGSVTTIDVDVDGEVVATMDVPFTGGWDIPNAKWVTVPAAIPAGNHDIGFTFTSGNSGSFSQVAFSNDFYLDLYVFTDAEVIDDDTTQDKGGSGQPIQLMEEYGCGYSSLNDVVAFYDVDFGANGAKTATMRFGYGADTPTTLAIYVDDMNAAPVCELSISNTGGWTIADSGYVEVPMTVPAGVHDLFIEFTNEMSGSVSELHFVEADPAPVVEDVAGEATAPATFDAGVIAAVAAIVSAAGFAISKKH